MKNINIFLIIFLTIINGCVTGPESINYKDVFSIYLVKDSHQFYMEEKQPLEDMILETEPLLSVNTIDSYDWELHLLSYQSETMEEMKKKEPLLHYTFVVAANDERIYWGMFFDDADSYYCFNPIIRLVPRHPDKTSILPFFVIDKCYPGDPIDTTIVDLRGDIRIYRALKKAGKLIE